LDGRVDDDGLLDRWRAIFSAPVVGWDFSRFGDSVTGDVPPWSYDDLARTALTGVVSVLDLGTGGGEVLSSLADALPVDTVATEGWPPNVPIARAALAGLGVDVFAYDAETDPRLPFPERRFDVVLDRHEAYDVDEIVRVLRPGGIFLTQQVDGRDLAELNELLDGALTAYSHVTVDHLSRDCARAGLDVELAQEWSGRLQMADVDTLVGYLAMTPWTVDGFSVDSRADTLLRLHRAAEPLVFTQRRFVLRGRVGA
jgi:SAM-dependent methyltransferase